MSKVAPSKASNKRKKTPLPLENLVRFIADGGELSDLIKFSKGHGWSKDELELVYDTAVEAVAQERVKAKAKKARKKRKRVAKPLPWDKIRAAIAPLLMGSVDNAKVTIDKKGQIRAKANGAVWRLYAVKNRESGEEKVMWTTTLDVEKVVFSEVLVDEYDLDAIHFDVQTLWK